MPALKTIHGTISKVLSVVAFLCGAALVHAAVDLTKVPPAATRPVDFAKDIQPIFAAHCYPCHGEKKQEAAFRLDDKTIALKGGELGVAIVPGKSAESLLIHAVANASDAIARMPKKGEPLTTEQIGLLRAWIDQGAVWPDNVAAAKKDNRDHWAFKAPVRPRPPAIQNEKLKIKNPIDAFVLARLQKEGLGFSPEADKITILRRLSLDLIGLPPTIEEVDAFLADKSSRAYEKQVERLLASPHYGERWGRHWLDAARFADSDGYEKDMSRDTWPYRDYVINAFNRDLPYDQFIIEQIAGDILAKQNGDRGTRNQDMVVATGFLRNSMVNMEGAIDPEQFRMEGMFDRMDAIGKSVLGLTIQCAQCHNHKFDPFSQEEYYRLFAFINNDHEARPAVFSTNELQKITQIKAGVARIEKDLQRRNSDWKRRMAEWEHKVAGDQPSWQIAWPLEHIGENSQRYYLLNDQSLLAQGYAPTKGTVTFKSTNQFTGITAVRLELLTDPNLPFNGPGRSFMGTCALTEFTVEAVDAQNPTNKAKVKIVSASTDYDQPERVLEANFSDKSTNNRVTGPIRFAIDGNGNTAWGIDSGPGQRNTDRKAVFVLDKPVGFAGGTILTFHLKQDHGGWNSDDHMNNNLGRFRLSVTTNAGPVAADPLPKRVRDIITEIPRDQRTPEQVAEIFKYWRTTVPEWKEANEKIDALMKDWPAGVSPLALMARTETRDTHLLRRGDWLKPGKSVTTGVPAILNPLPKNADGSRLTFARWLADKKSPTTARVFVNRVWLAYFGNGIVNTPEDFGMQSETPSHPELLDWLACEFMDSGWSIKSLHRLIVTSATYRQSSHMTPELYAKDPYNRLLARGPRFRVEGEIVRDISLAASGLLNPKVGGRSVMPTAPAFLFQPPASYAPFPWVDATDSEKYRRGLYTFRRRSTPYPMLQTFDVPNGDSSCVRRQRSNSPLQALTSLNEPIFVECAQNLARQTLERGGTSDAERISYAFRCAVSRPPTADEKQELIALLEKQRQRLMDGQLKPNEIATGVAGAPVNLPAGVTPNQLAAYTVVSRVLLNLDETITKE